MSMGDPNSASLLQADGRALSSSPTCVHFIASDWADSDEGMPGQVTNRRRHDAELPGRVDRHEPVALSYSTSKVAHRKVRRFDTIPDAVHRPRLLVMDSE
jgi:hypothetical protein